MRFILEYFGIIEPNVRIGVNMIMPKDKAHGHALVQGARGFFSVPFRVDRPSRLDRPGQELVQDIILQLGRLGFGHVDTLELTGNRTRLLYRVKSMIPSFISRSKVV